MGPKEEREEKRRFAFALFQQKREGGRRAQPPGSVLAADGKGEDGFSWPFRPSVRLSLLISALLNTKAIFFLSKTIEEEEKGFH